MFAYFGSVIVALVVDIRIKSKMEKHGTSSRSLIISSLILVSMILLLLETSFLMWLWCTNRINIYPVLDSKSTVINLLVSNK